MLRALPRGARWQVAVSVAAIALALLLAAGAAQIPAQAGYAGVGPNFLPWVVAAALAACGAFLLRQALSGGFRDLDPPSGAERGDLGSMAWVVAGLAANAALITTIGFVLSCTLCYVLAVHGLRRSEGRAWRGPSGVALDAVTGFLIAGPTFWLFTKLLGIGLPAATTTGWL